MTMTSYDRSALVCLHMRSRHCCVNSILLRTGMTMETAQDTFTELMLGRGRKHAIYVSANHLSSRRVVRRTQRGRGRLRVEFGMKVRIFDKFIRAKVTGEQA